MGEPVDCTGLRSMSLDGPHVLWLVQSGALDLFAVDAAQQGHWHFLGRLGPGALLLGPVEGPRHTLVGRPLRGCALRRVWLRELQPQTPPPHAWGGTGHVPEDDQYAQGYGYDAYGYDAYGHDAYGHDAYGYGHGQDAGHGYGVGQAYGPSPLEHAFAVGVGHSLRVLSEAPRQGHGGAEPPPSAEDLLAAPDDDEILWVRVPPGSVRYGAEYGADVAADLLVDGALWQRLVNQQYRLTCALDRWIDHLEQAHEDRTAAGIAAGETVKAQADQALLASIRTRGGGGAGVQAEATDDETLAVCRTVARAAGITLTAPAAGASPLDERTDPIERIALASRIRTRGVGLRGRWWRENVGPLVGRQAFTGHPVALLWRRGRYEAVDADGRRTRIGTPGVAARFEPRAVMLYRPLPDRPVGAWRLARFCLHGTRPDLGTLALGSLVAVALGALVPIATGRVLGVYVPAAETGLIVQAALAVMVSSVVTAAFMLLQNLSVLRLEGRVESTLQPAVWDRLLRLPTRFFTRRSTGELASAALGVSHMRRVLSGVGPVAVQSSTVGAMSLVLLLWYSVPLTLAALGLLTVVCGTFLVLGLWQVRWERRLTKLSHKLNNRAFQTLRGLPKLRVAAAESFAYAAWAREFARSREIQQRVGRIKNVTTGLSTVYLPLTTLVMFMLLAGPARGTLTAGDFLTFNTAVTMLLTSVTQITGAFLSAASALPLFEQIRPVLDELPEVPGGSAHPGVLTGRLEARNLSFRYTDDGPLVLDDVSVEVAPGEFVAVVGPSGCGKSTLLRMLIGFDAPDHGSVLYDGQDLAALDRAAVRRQCGVVLQHAQPVVGSILDAIRGAEEFTLEEVWEAARMAGLAEDIEAMPMGMHTILSTGGGTISGGQRQRLMIAQALIRRPRVLFFDEATSALDNEAQRAVIDSTRALRCTRLVIAHRLSTIMDADRVLVMSAGRIVEQGTPAELLARPDGPFHHLVRRQLA
nr:NHLP bacteriocin export ABC transporter permease/ATPase subunit [Streptomyces sp. JJ38]